MNTFNVIVEKFDIWTIVGFSAQVAFTARFIVQWIASERKGKSFVPIVFWYLSIIGGLGLLIYAIARADPVFIVGQSCGCIIYLRNIMLIFKEKGIQPE